jgi:hypothetical protein
VPAPPDFAPEFLRHVDDQGRTFDYARVVHPGSSGLGIHFSAFFGDWGNKKRTRADFRGYFHRLRMLGTDQSHDWLFLCDPYGAQDNGTYYTGHAGDLFVERAVIDIIGAEMDARDHGYDQVVTLGSSMGGTGALAMGLRFAVAGIVTICPHVSLDICATRCDKYPEVAYICPDGDPVAPDNHWLTHRVRRALDVFGPDRPPPHLFVQSMADDRGVHIEQVLPLVETWRAHGGSVALDVRPTGGHTSDHASRALLLDATDALLAGRPIDTERYRTDPAFAGTSSALTPTEKLVLAARARLKVRRRYERLRARVAPGRAP